MMNDFRSIILDQRKEKKLAAWEGPVIDYLQLVKETPDVANFAPGRIYTW